MSQIYISQKREKHQVNKNIYGHFAEHLGRCIYEGFWVGEDSAIPNHKGIRLDVMEALKELNIPVLRWPGECFVDEYHWKDGIGPREQRKTIVNTRWGGVVENNHFGTHEFFDLCEMLDCEAYINGNVGADSVQEMQEWIEYMTFEGESPLANERKKNGRDKPWKVAFFGVGDETGGIGGNMRTKYHADLYRCYQAYARNDINSSIYKIARGPNIDDFYWMDVLMRIVGRYIDGISVHHYFNTGEWEKKGSALNFSEKEWFSLLARAEDMDELIARISKIMDKYDPEKRVGLIIDEWGSWLAVEPGTNPEFLYQQNTIRDAMLAAVTLHTFQEHGDRVTMANIAQTVNVLEALILTDGEKMLKTPTYHVFEMLKDHQEGMLLDTKERCLSENISSSVTKKGDTMTISLCNYSLDTLNDIEYILEDGVFAGKDVKAYILMGDKMDAHNTFEAPEQVSKTAFEEIVIDDNRMRVFSEPMSVVTISVRG